MTTTTASDRYTAASGLGSALEEAARQYGFDLAPICAALQIDPEAFSNLTGRVSLDRLCRLFEACALIAKDEAFGLKCVDHFKPGATGPYGFGLISAPTALDFFRFMAEHNAYVSEKSYSRITIDGNGAEIVWTFSPLIVKRLMGVVVRLAEQGTGILLIEQFTHIALKIAHHAHVMARGRITFAGEPRRLVDEPGILHRAYLAQ